MHTLTCGCSYCKFAFVFKFLNSTSGLHISVARLHSPAPRRLSIYLLPYLSLSLRGSKSQSQSHSGLPGVMGQDLQCSLFASSQPQRITEGSFSCCHRDERQILLVCTIALSLCRQGLKLLMSHSLVFLHLVLKSLTAKGEKKKVDGFLNE